MPDHLFAVVDRDDSTGRVISVETNRERAREAREIVRGATFPRPAVRRVRITYGSPIYRTVTLRAPIDFVPKHALSVPSLSGLGTEDAVVLYEGPDRERALRIAADRNRMRLLWGKSPRTWRLVVRLGEPLPIQAAMRLEAHGAVGFEAATVYRPFRLVWPTAKEVAKLAAEPAV